MSFKFNTYLPEFSSEKEIITELQEKICNYLGSDYAYPVTTGTSAITITLRAMKIPRGFHVIVPDLSYIATATAVADCGLIPVYCDIDTHFFGLSYDSLVRNYNPKVKAVIVVHFAGYVHREIFRIKDFCRDKGIYLIEDCAQAFPCSINGQKVGTIGDAGTCSFQSSKIINSGEGGLIVTGSQQIYDMCEAISNWGIVANWKEHNLSVPCSNFRMSSVQAYFLLKQLDMIDEIVKKRQDHVNQLTEYLSEHGIQVTAPAKVPGAVDCPFFLPVKSTTTYNTVEPRMEYPMRNSTIVKSILKRFYPDLMEEYLSINAGTDSEQICKQVLTNNDFINIANYTGFSFEDICKPYLS